MNRIISTNIIGSIFVVILLLYFSLTIEEEKWIIAQVLYDLH